MRAACCLVAWTAPGAAFRTWCFSFAACKAQYGARTCERRLLRCAPGFLSGRYRHACSAQSQTRFSSTSSLIARLDDAAERDALASQTRNADSDAVALVVGGARGIGLALVQQLMKRFRGHIYATCRDAAAAGALRALWQFAPDRITIVDGIDVRDEKALAALAQRIKSDKNRVDVLINCAGILHSGSSGPSARNPGGSGRPERSLSELDPDWMRYNFEVNTLGPALVSKHISPLMTTSRKPDRTFSVLATISARVGSISDNRLGGWYSYRISKAAQNQLTKTMSVELKRRGVVCVALHPGTVNTELSEPFQARVDPAKLQPVERAASNLLDVLDALCPDDTGSFLAYDGTSIEW